MFSFKQAVEFEEASNPHEWFLVASEIHEQVLILSANGFKSSFVSLRDNEGQQLREWNTNNRTIFLLAGFALENIIKAYLVYEHPEYVEGGQLSKQLKNHNLTKLAAKSKFIPYKKRAFNTLMYFEEGLESWARYPCGLNWAQTKSQSILNERMWNNYRWLMRVYEKRFKHLMSKGWKGPHSFSGKFVISGDWFDDNI
ncbi:hypothetical protein [uncultured Methylophaga sp.]|uniref:hypothetical protein n=1 Tax=uncultured Methylophaga sp. TaxID=285271 RepID=UPI0030FC9899